MPTKDSTIVRLPDALVARIDRARGPKSRAAYLLDVLDAHEHVPPAAVAGTNANGGNVSKAKPRRRSGNDCPHPVGRRIGDTCAACGDHVG